MKITRAPRRSHFTIIPNDTARDHRLPLRALGLLTRLLSYPDGWSTDARALARMAPDGRDAIATALRDLEAHGYLVRRRFRTDRGTWATEAEVFDEPQTREDPAAGQDQDGKPVTVPTSEDAASSQVAAMTAHPAPVEPDLSTEDGQRRNPPTPPRAGGRCSRHPSGPVTGRPCRGCGTDRASLAAAERRAAAAAASAAAAARAAARTGIGAERDPLAATVGAPAVRAARAAARAR